MGNLLRAVSSASGALILLSCAQILGTGGYSVEESQPDARAAETDTEGTTNRDTDASGETGDGAPDASAEPSSNETEAGPPQIEPEAGSSDTLSSEPPPPDAGPTPEAGPPDECLAPVLGTCDTYPQCGCENNEGCSVLNNNTGSTGCAPAGTVQPYTACTEPTGECEAGYGCVGGVCKPFCDGLEMATCGEGPYNACIQVTGQDADIPGYFVCERTCDPVDPTRTDDRFKACGEGANCLPAADGVSSCISADPAGVENTSCATEFGPDPFLCAPGLSCVTLGEEALCFRNCELGSDDCGAGVSCLPYVTDVAAADKLIGYCSTCSIPEGSSCSVLTQCGCQPNEMCAIGDLLTGVAECLPIGAGQLGDACDGPGQCQPGLDCAMWEVSGSCTPYCQDVGTDCPNPDAVCLVWEQGGAGLCLQGCDPRYPSTSEAPFFACADGQSCSIWFDYQSGQCFEPLTLGTAGNSCAQEEDCAPGYTCAGNGGFACAQWCAVAGADCQPGEECLPDFYFRALGTQTNANLYLSSSGVEFGHCAAGIATETVDEPVAIPDAPSETAPGTVLSELTVSGVPVNRSVSFVRLSVDITHEFVGDLQVSLISPQNETVLVLDGTQLPPGVVTTLTATFDDTGAWSISDGSEPFSETYIPEQPLWSLVGTPPNGVWTLQVQDMLSEDEGTLNGWTLTLF